MFIIAKIWKQPRCPSTDEWIKKMCYTDTHTQTHTDTHRHTQRHTETHTHTHTQTHTHTHTHTHTPSPLRCPEDVQARTGSSS